MNYLYITGDQIEIKSFDNSSSMFDIAGELVGDLHCDYRVKDIPNLIYIADDAMEGELNTLASRLVGEDVYGNVIIASITSSYKMRSDYNGIQDLTREQIERLQQRI